MSGVTHIVPDCPECERLRARADDLSGQVRVLMAQRDRFKTLYEELALASTQAGAPIRRPPEGEVSP